jgi:choline dehydrogenase-like flavoprotein
VIVAADTVEGDLSADLAIVGAGPAGIVTALEVAAAGFDVVLIESGHGRHDPDVQALGEAADRDPELHAPMSIATRRQIGGASTIWGGRCVPYDPVDFDHRPWVTDHEWPVSYDELRPYFQRACDWFLCGRAVFDATQTRSLPASIVPGLPNEDVHTSTLERWSLPTDFGRAYRDRLRASTRLKLVSGLTCTEIAVAHSGAGIDRLVCRTLTGREISVRARRAVVACGGLESTRLLLASPGLDGRPVGNHSDHLGRWYMAHVEGVVANVRFTTLPRETIYGYERDDDGVYVHRRLTFSREFQDAQGLTNIAGWLVHPGLADPRHGSGVLSFAYLALSSPAGRLLAPEALRLAMTGRRVPGVPHARGERGPLSQHLRNIARDPAATAGFVVGFGTKRFLAHGRKAPGFAVYNPGNVYPLQYHGEHRPQPDSRVRLADARDGVGMKRLSIDLRFSEDDVEGVVRAHRHWDEHLRSHGAGRIEYLYDDVAEAVRSRLGGGFHQTGTTRMSARPEDGVLDRNLAVHGLPTLHVASSSAFPTSSQANSTFMIVVFGLRLADHLREALS